MENSVTAMRECADAVSYSDNTVWFNARGSLFTIGGIEHPDSNNGEYYRLNAFDKASYSDGNRNLAECTSGASVRFITDAKEFTFKAVMRGVINGMTHFADRGAFGFDVYTGSGTDRKYCGGQMQMCTDPVEMTQKLGLPGVPTEVMIDLPLYGGVSELLIGLPEGSLLAKAPGRTIPPIVFYGSSITQGGCVSRPGNMYSNIICRMLDADCVNLGFSGCAFGEQSAAQYIAGRRFSAFVMDYDYNARSLQELSDTHEPFYRAVRKTHTFEPVIFVTHPYYAAETDADRARKEIVRKTYENAFADGENVFFVDSESFFPLAQRDLNAVDNLHPNDLGHYRMYETIFPAVRKSLGIRIL